MAVGKRSGERQVVNKVYILVAKLLHSKEVGSIIFWGGIIFNRRSSLMPILQNMTTEIYLKDHIVQEEFRRELEQGNITWLAWPANSPDINPVENMWDLVARAIHNNINPLPTTEKLTVVNVIVSMHKRVNGLIVSRGGHTSYWLLLTVFFILILFIKLSVFLYLMC